MSRIKEAHESLGESFHSKYHLAFVAIIFTPKCKFVDKYFISGV